MKKLTSIIIFFALYYTSYCQFGFRDFEKENLKNLAKLWGFIKYHHPDVQNCAIDWDKALLESLEELDGATQSTYKAVVESIIGKVEPIDAEGERPQDINDELLNNLDFEWIENSNFSDTAKHTIVEMVEALRRNNHCLYEPYYEGVSFDFSNEKSYIGLGQYPDKYYRVLAFFRYWNAIDYFFPYKHIMDQGWDATFNQFVLPIIYAENEETYHLKFREFTGHINDSHSFFSSFTFRNWLGIELTPFKLNYIEEKTVITEVAEPGNGLEIGDIILEIDKIPIDSLRQNLKNYTVASNDVTTQRNINDYLILGKEKEFNLKVMKANGEEVLINNLERDASKYNDFHFGASIESPWKIINTDDCGEIGYVNMGLLQSIQIQNMVSNLWDKETIIFDIRNYPNGTLWDLVHHLFNEPIHIADFTVPYPDYAGQFEWHSEIIGSTNTNEVFNGRLILLFNELTQSQAEYTIMGLEQHPNAIKIGSQTAAADGNVSSLTLPGGISTFFTGLGTYYPDRTPTQRIGIVPDFEVKPTIEGIRNGIDEVLEFALNCNKLNELTTVKETPSNHNITIYPNPVQDFIYVSKRDDDITDLIIYDTKGNIVYNEYFFSNSNIVDCSKFPPGYYIVAIKAESSNIYKSKKLLKQ